MKQRRPITRECAERKKQKRRGILTAAAFLAFTFAVLIALDAYRCAHEFVVTGYSFKTSKVSSPVRIVMVSDLHESEFGKNNSELIQAVKQLEPDVILSNGDLISHNDTEDEIVIGLDFISAMADIAPFYTSLGNHEKTYIEKHGTGILDLYREHGANLLELCCADLTLNGQTVRVGGISEYCFNYGQYWEDYYSSEKYAFLNDFCDTQSYKVLLCHRPTAYRLESEAASYEDWDCELVLSGHTHGGLWRLPVIGCPYLPQQGFFPKYDYGIFDMGNADMIIGAGLGHEGAFFRLFDPCELVVIELLPEA